MLLFLFGFWRSSFCRAFFLRLDARSANYDAFAVDPAILEIDILAPDRRYV